MPPLRLVLDTNVVLDLLLYADRHVAMLAAMLADGRAECLADAAALAEFERVLGYPELRLDTAAAAALSARYRALLRRVATPVELPPGIPRCRDPDDQKFVDLAVVTGADLLLSRDRQLLALARKVRRCAPQLSIVTPESWSKQLSAPGIDGAS